MKTGKDGVSVRAGGRLHLGLVKISDKPEFIAAGLCLDEPFCEVVVRPAGGGKLTVTGDVSGAIRRVIKTVCESAGAPCNLSARVKRALPLHSGFGSGTRHALSAAKAVCGLLGKRVNTKALAGITGRGNRSMIGVSLFDKGGFAAGVGGDIVTMPAPKSWRVVLIHPDCLPGNRKVWQGAKEVRHITGAPVCSNQAKRRLTGAVCVDMAAAVESGDFGMFEKSVEMLQQQAVKLFGQSQGGAASTESGRKIVRFLRRAGIRAVGQSSWGATLFAVVPSESDAETLVEKLRIRKEALSVAVTGISNCGFKARKV